MTQVRQNGAFTEYGPSHTKSKSGGVNNIQTGGHIASTRNHGGHHRMNSIMSHHRHSEPSRTSSRHCHHHHHHFDRNDRFDRYEREQKPSFGQKLGNFLKSFLPVAIGIGGALLLGNPGALKGIGGFLGKLFGGTKTPVTTPEVKTPEVKTPDTKAPEVKTPETNTPPTTPEVKTPEVKTPEVKTPETNTPAPAPEHTVVKGETIFTIIQNQIKEQKPNATKDEILELTKKTIAANKELLEGNNAKKPIYKTVGDYIEIGDVLKLVLK